MHIQNCNVLNFAEKRLEKSIQKIQTHLCLSESDLQSILNVPNTRFGEIKNNWAKLSAAELDKIAKSIGVNAYKILHGDVDFDVLKDHAKGKFGSISSKYQQHGSSRMRTLSSIIEYIQATRPQLTHELLGELQIHPNALFNYEDVIDISLINDAYDSMERCGYQKNDFLNSGFIAALEFRNSPLFYSSFTQTTNPVELYSNFFGGQIRYVDMNWEYTVTKLTPTHGICKVSTREEIQDLYHTHHYGCKGLCHHRLGFAAGLLQYLDRKPSQVLETKCFHRGDPYCQIEVFY